MRYVSTVTCGVMEWHTIADKQTDGERQTERQLDRHTDRQTRTCRQTIGQTDRQMYRQTDRWTGSNTKVPKDTSLQSNSQTYCEMHLSIQIGRCILLIQYTRHASTETVRQALHIYKSADDPFVNGIPRGILT